MVDNPLVAERRDSNTAYSGIGIVETAVTLYNGVEDKSWLEAGLGVAGTGLEALAITLDPIGMLGQYAVSWLIEKIKPLREALDWLAGDPDQIHAYAQTWKNVAQSVEQISDQFTTEVTSGTSQWTGGAADAYRAMGTDHAQYIKAASTGAKTIGSVVDIVGTLVAAVRGIVRDLIAACISALLVRLPQWLLEEAVTIGLATPHVVAAAGTLIAEWTAKISEFITKLTTSLTKLRGILGKLNEVWEAIRQGLAKGASKITDASTTAASAVRNRVSYEVGGLKSGWKSAMEVEPAPAGAVHINGDGTMAMSATNPMGGGTSLAERIEAFKQGKTDYIHELKADGARYPESAAHIRDAQAAGQKRIIELDKSPNAKANADARRAESLKGYETKPGYDLDEYPPASSYDGGRGASVRHVLSADNRGSGSSWWRWGVAGLPDHAKVKVTPINVD